MFTAASNRSVQAAPMVSADDHSRASDAAGRQAKGHIPLQMPVRFQA